MSALARLSALAAADVRERTRRSSFLAVLAGAVYLAYVVGSGKLSLTVGDCTGEINGAWVGTAVSLATSVFLTLAGFYIVRGGLAYDRRTGVGDILRTTSLSPWAYMATKAVSALCVLLAMVAVLAASALLTLTVHHVPTLTDLAGLLEPFVAVVVPAMIAVAGIAVLFDALPVLQGGVGNVAYFFLWIAGLSIAGATESQWDVGGLGLYVAPLKAAVHAVHPQANENFILGSMGRPTVGTFPWHGLAWTPFLVATRLLWCAVGAGAVALAAAVYRPEAMRGGARVVKPSKKAKRAAADAAPVATVAETVRLRALPPGRSFGVLPLAVAETRLLLAGLPRLWYLVALGLAIACWATPLKVAREYILPIAWIWPMLRFSTLGVSAAQDGVEAILLGTPRAVPRLTIASWLAGFVVAAALGAGCAVRFALVGDGMAALAWLGGAALVPAAALALGAWSGTTRLFEAVYLVIWYIGPMNHVPQVDYTGVTEAAVRHGSGAVCLALAVGCVLAAQAARLRRLRV